MTLARLDEVLQDAAAARAGRRRLQRGPDRARRGAGGGRRDDRPAGGAADQRERRALPRCAGADRVGHQGDCRAGRGAVRAAPGPRRSARHWSTRRSSCGFTSVMFDGSALDDASNRERTRAVARRCHAAGVCVEAELGEIGGKDGVHAPGCAPTRPRRPRFVADTGVDALAVAVGSSHAMTSRTAQIDLALVAAIHATVPVPLVLHGSSGVPDADLVGAVEAGMTKINIATHLNTVFTTAVREYLASRPGRGGHPALPRRGAGGRRGRDDPADEHARPPLRQRCSRRTALSGSLPRGMLRPGRRSGERSGSNGERPGDGRVPRVAAAAGGGLDGHARHAAPVDPGRRQDPAGPGADGQPLVAGDAVRHAAGADHVRRPGRESACSTSSSTSSTPRCASAPATAATARARARAEVRRRLPRRDDGRPARARGGRRHPADPHRGRARDPVRARTPSTRRTTPRPLRAVLAAARAGVPGDRRSSAPASSARSARSTSSGAASTWPAPASPGRPRRGTPAVFPTAPTG